MEAELARINAEIASANEELSREQTQSERQENERQNQRSELSKVEAELDQAKADCKAWMARLRDEELLSEELAKKKADLEVEVQRVCDAEKSLTGESKHIESLQE